MKTKCGVLGRYVGMMSLIVIDNLRVTMIQRAEEERFINCVLSHTKTTCKTKKSTRGNQREI